ncbi:hypothetical protein D1BOALGB6SA_10603 [Olavius sp. associated proteobacterium Delta 1]|nr:hypothetical protein D1BOALGB6SA_10603 [Olavius sp. associated proteobacterium Delta 1]
MIFNIFVSARKECADRYFTSLHENLRDYYCLRLVRLEDLKKIMH